MNTITVPTIALASAIIQKTNPLTLELVAVTIMPTGGFQNPKLEQRHYPLPPADGIYEFDFQIDEPTGPAPDKLTAYAAVTYWTDFPQDTLKGVRIHGSSEPKTILISK